MADLIQELYETARADFFAHGPSYNTRADGSGDDDAYTPDVCAWDVVASVVNDESKAQAYMSALIASGPPPRGLEDTLEFGVENSDTWAGWVQAFLRQRITEMLEAHEDVREVSARRHQLLYPTSTT